MKPIDDPITTKQPIWIVDDDAAIRFVLEKALQRQAFTTVSFDNPNAVLKAFEAVQQPDDMPQLLISDIRMPGGSGLDLLAKVRQQHPQLPVIITTAFTDLDSAVSALQGGAFEYLPKPFDITQVVDLVQRAVAQNAATAPSAAVTSSPSKGAEMLGQAPAMQELFRAIGRLSQSTVTVLVTGESGTGKELVALALHKHSPCKAGPFVAINTAAIPKDLLESELFGHERGAFTGAQATRKGRFEQAEGGTLFLDEIGDMPLELQTRLLRVLSDGQYYRVGGHSAIQSKVRVIAATHQDLENRVKEGVFREDLFHRLNVIRLRLPPLRERAQDIAPLTQHFLQKSAKQLGVAAKRIGADALHRISAFPFPGNVRQLENMCHWLTVMAAGQVVETKDLPPEIAAQLGTADGLTAGSAGDPAAPTTTSTPAETTASLIAQWPAADTAQADISHANHWEHGVYECAQQALATGTPNLWDALTQRFETQLIRAALEQTGGRRIEAAQLLGMGRNTLTRKIQELGLGD